MEKPLFCVVQESDSASFLQHKKEIHLIEITQKPIVENVYFVPTALMKSSLKFRDKSLFVPVSFPESQLFMAKKFAKRIHLINDEHGRAYYGCAAYFVPLLLYRKQVTDFEQEMVEVVN